MGIWATRRVADTVSGAKRMVPNRALKQRWLRHQALTTHLAPCGDSPVRGEHSPHFTDEGTEPRRGHATIHMASQWQGHHPKEQG